MLTPKQIKKLSRPYTDYQICNESWPIVGNDWWGNGYVFFCESAPADTREYHDDPRTMTESLRQRLAGTVTATDYTVVQPVEIRDDNNGRGEILRFSDGNGVTVWVDARYIVAAIKRADCEVAIEWRYVPNASDVPVIVASMLDNIIMILVEMGTPEERHAYWEWQLINEEMPRRVELKRPEPINVDQAAQIRLF